MDLGKAAAKTPPPAPPPATPEVPRALDTPEFRETWSRWVEHRGEIGKPLTRTHLAAQFSRLEEWGEARALAAINFSITRGYESICEEKPNGNARKQHRGRDEYLPI